MTDIRFKKMLCLGWIGPNGENYLDMRHERALEPEIKQYFYQKYKNKPGSVLFFKKNA